MVVASLAAAAGQLIVWTTRKCGKRAGGGAGPTNTSAVFVDGREQADGWHVQTLSAFALQRATGWRQPSLAAA
jgi:hypothetical protein